MGAREEEVTTRARRISAPSTRWSSGGQLAPGHRQLHGRHRERRRQEMPTPEREDGPVTEVQGPGARVGDRVAEVHQPAAYVGAAGYRRWSPGPAPAWRPPAAAPPWRSISKCRKSGSRPTRLHAGGTHDPLGRHVELLRAANHPAHPFEAGRHSAVCAAPEWPHPSPGRRNHAVTHLDDMTARRPVEPDAAYHQRRPRAPGSNRRRPRRRRRRRCRQMAGIGRRTPGCRRRGGTRRPRAGPQPGPAGGRSPARPPSGSTDAAPGPPPHLARTTMAGNTHWPSTCFTGQLHDYTTLLSYRRSSIEGLPRIHP